MIQQPMVLEAIDVVTDVRARTAGQINHGSVAPAGREAAVGVVFIRSVIVPAPTRVQLDEVQFDESRVRVFAVLRYLQQAALDITGFIVDVALEGANQRIDAIAVAGERIRLGLRCLLDHDGLLRQRFRRVDGFIVLGPQGPGERQEQGAEQL
jgi:hypothetical protein